MYLVMQHTDKVSNHSLKTLGAWNSFKRASEEMLKAECDFFREMSAKYPGAVIGGGNGEDAAVSYPDANGYATDTFYVVEAPDSVDAPATAPDKVVIKISEHYSRTIVISDPVSTEYALELAGKLYEDGDIDALDGRDFEGSTDFEVVAELRQGDADYDKYAEYRHFNEEGEMP